MYHFLCFSDCWFVRQSELFDNPNPDKSMDLFWCWLTSNFNSTTPLKRKRPILNICERSHDGVGFALFGRNGGTEINRGICLDVFFKHFFSVSHWNPQEFTGFQVSSVGIIFHIMTNRSSETFDQDIRDLEKVVSFYWDSSLGLVSFFFCKFMMWEWNLSSWR